MVVSEEIWPSTAAPLHIRLVVGVADPFAPVPGQPRYADHRGAAACAPLGARPESGRGARCPSDQRLSCPEALRRLGVAVQGTEPRQDGGVPRRHALCRPWRVVMAGRRGGTSLLDVEEALVHEFVDAEGTEFAAEAGALRAAEREVRALARRGVDVGHPGLELLGDLGRAGLVRGPDGAAEAEVHDVRELDRLVVAGHLVDDGDRAEQLLLVGA